MQENKLFTNIIGYEKEKKTLTRLVDILNNTNKYKKLGARVPYGLLIYGDPGVGKTTIVKELINNLNRKSYIVRKVKTDGKFVSYLNEIFEKAKQNQPSIIFLDDLDKFSEVKAGSTNEEEYVAIQGLIDDIRDQYLNVFVVATANDIDSLPNSLKRAGRFDIKIHMDLPNEKESYEILKYYLSNKKIDKNVNIKNISLILSNVSCADLEKVTNQAAIYAGYENKTEIGMEDLVRSSLEFKYKVNGDDIEKKDKYNINIAYHEAGHVLIGELLEQHSVSFVTIAESDSDDKGFTTYHINDYYWQDVKFMINRIKTLLAGKAATEIVYNTCDTGANSDLHRAYDIVERFVDNYCMFNFNSWFRRSSETSEKVKQSKDDKINELMTKYYHEVKELLIKNRSKLDRLAHELNNKKILFQDEIEAICLNN